jgi:DNA repair exonuclease SbcCD ATPase subunit
MVSIKEHLEELLESFDYSGDVEERIRLLRAAIGRIGNMFYGTENEEIYADQVRRIKLRLRELRETYSNCEDCWRELMDNLEELRDQIERLAIRGGIIEK